MDAPHGKPVSIARHFGALALAWSAAVAGSFAWSVVQDGPAVAPHAIAHAAILVLGLAGVALTARSARAWVRVREQGEAALRALEHELAQARKLEAVGRLAGGVAHDLNNLLSPILGNAALALEALGPDDPAREPLQDILEAAERARRVTQRLLAFGRKQRLAPEPLDVSEVVSGLRPLLGDLAGGGIPVALEVAAGLPAVRADRSQLELVLLNLVANARDAMPGGGRLGISAAAEALDPAAARFLGVAPGRYVVVAVSDTGVGMDDATRVRLFEPFFTTKPPGKGTGLGLASVHGIVQQHGGAVAVRTAPGEGATFRVLLPVAEGAPAPVPAPEVPAPRGHETVLLAEDDPGVRRYAVAALAQLGYDVLVAASGEEALRVAAAHDGPIHVLLSDLVMPGLSGRELRRRLDAARPGIPTLFMSGYAGESLADTATPLLAKPFTPADLGRALRKVLDAGR
jgi:two-component system, cell cycle sensor histidine kinase and response regulator CckA